MRLDRKFEFTDINFFQYAKYFDALYCLPWIDWNKENQKTILLMMTNINRLLTLKLVGGYEANFTIFIPVSSFIIILLVFVALFIA